jgi:hypothetical protein
VSCSQAALKSRTSIATYDARVPLPQEHQGVVGSDDVLVNLLRRAVPIHHLNTGGGVLGALQVVQGGALILVLGDEPDACRRNELSGGVFTLGGCYTRGVCTLSLVVTTGSVGGVEHFCCVLASPGTISLFTWSKSPVLYLGSRFAISNSNRKSAPSCHVRKRGGMTKQKLDEVTAKLNKESPLAKF